MKENRTGVQNPIRQMACGAVIAAVYVAVTLAFAPISYGPIQFRISEALCILPYFTPAAIPGLFLGCMIANLLGTAALPDVIFGSIATLIGAAGSYALRKNRFMVSVPPILSNALIIPWVLRNAYGAEDMIWFLVVTIGIGEILAVGVLGQILLRVLEKYRTVIFGKAVTM